MWKKRIGGWSFDMKNNKLASVAAAATHDQQCLDQDKYFNYMSSKSHVFEYTRSPEISKA